MDVKIERIERSDSEIAKLEDRDRILSFEKKLSQIPGAFFGDSDNCPLKHTFADGVYVREITIPKGILLVGKIHRHSHPNFLMSGEVTVITESGGIERLKAPQSIISPPGTKRIVYTHEDTVWITVHVTEEKDLEKIEDYVIAPSYDEFENIKTIKSDEENINHILDYLKEDTGG